MKKHAHGGIIYEIKIKRGNIFCTDGR